MYILKQSREFLPYVDAVWTRKSRLNPHRGFEDDDIDDLEVDDTAQTAAQKSAIVEDMLGMVANHCHIISRRSILEATSLADVWHKIRLHFNFQAAGSRFLGICKIRQEADERPEDLYQRISSFVYDNLLTRDCGITHHGERIAEDEDVSPTVENFVMTTWLQLLHSDLPDAVQQRFCTDLRSRTLASLKPEISSALDAMLSDIRHLDVKAARFQRPQNKCNSGTALAPLVPNPGVLFVMPRNFPTINI